MTEITQTTDAIDRRGWVFYDGECRFCRRWVRSMTGVLDRHGFSMVSFQSQWVAARLGRSISERPTELVLLTVGGEMVGGIDALVFLARHVSWARVLCLPARLPGVMPVLRVVYRIVARNRYRLWGRCSSAGCAVSHRTLLKGE